METILTLADRGGSTRVVFWLLLAGFCFLSPSGRAQDRSGKEVPCSWEAPTYGTPVVHYVLQVVELGGAQPDTTVYDQIPGLSRNVFVAYGNVYKARVAGVDAEGRQGPWSLWTPLYGPEMDHGE